MSKETCNHEWRAVDDWAYPFAEICIKCKRYETHQSDRDEEDFYLNTEEAH